MGYSKEERDKFSSDMEAGWTERMAPLDKYNKGDVTAGTKVSQDFADEGRSDAMARSEQTSKGNVSTNEALANMLGGSGYTSDILQRDLGSDIAKSQSGVTNTFNRMDSEIQAKGREQADAQAYELSKQTAQAIYQKDKDEQAVALARAQADAAERGPFGTILGVGGAIVGGIYGGPAGATAGYSAGSSLGTAVS